MMATAQTAPDALANDLPVARSWSGRSSKRPLETQSRSMTLPEATGGSIDMNLTTHIHFEPSCMADRVSTADEFMGREVAAMFDKDGNSKGACRARDTGWKSTRMWQVKFESYGLPEPWEPEILPDATFKARLKAAIQREIPILFDYWTPESVHAAHDITPVGEQARAEGRGENVNLGKKDWLEASHFHASASTQAFTSSNPDRRKSAIPQS